MIGKQKQKQLLLATCLQKNISKTLVKSFGDFGADKKILTNLKEIQSALTNLKNNVCRTCFIRHNLAKFGHNEADTLVL